MLAGLLALAATYALAAPPPAEPVVLVHAYSHNDYNQKNALFDALDRGFMGVEADVHLRGDEFYVAHTGGGIKPGRTLRSLYLDPLLKRVRANGGRVYKGGPKGFLLMIEFKSDGEDSYRLLRAMLEPYKEMLTTYYQDHVKEGAVTISITGHRPNDMLRVEDVRWAGIDGDLGDEGEDHPTLFPTISDSWPLRAFCDGDIDDESMRRLVRYVQKAHAKGRKIRFYAIEDDEACWSVLLKAGVDYVNTDHLESLKQFLLKRVSSRRRPIVAAELALTHPELFFDGVR